MYFFVKLDDKKAKSKTFDAYFLIFSFRLLGREPLPPLP